MKIELDFNAGDRVICLISGKYSTETLTGAARASINPDGSILCASLEIDRKDPIYTHTNIFVDIDNVFRTKAEALAALGFDDIAE